MAVAKVVGLPGFMQIRPKWTVPSDWKGVCVRERGGGDSKIQVVWGGFVVYVVVQAANTQRGVY